MESFWKCPILKRLVEGQSDCLLYTYDPISLQLIKFLQKLQKCVVLLITLKCQLSLVYQAINVHLFTNLNALNYSTLLWMVYVCVCFWLHFLSGIWFYEPTLVVKDNIHTVIFKQIIFKRVAKIFKTTIRRSIKL